MHALLSEQEMHQIGSSPPCKRIISKCEIDKILRRCFEVTHWWLGISRAFHLWNCFAFNLVGLGIEWAFVSSIYNWAKTQHCSPRARFIAEIYLKILPRHELKYCNGTEEMIEQRCKMEKYRVAENPRKFNKSKIENLYSALRNWIVDTINPWHLILVG